MPELIVDRELCTKDGLCALECPMGVIDPPAEDGWPVFTAEGRELCIECGHCVAVCPVGAMSLDSMPAADCPSIKKELAVAPEQFEQLIKARRSIRLYRDRKVGKELIAKLIELTRWAPSGHNSQPVHWLVIYDSDEVRRLAGLTVDWMRWAVEEQPELAQLFHFERIIAAWEGGYDRICRHAPHVIVAHAPQDERAAPAACTIALTYLEVAAYNLGLGACWAGYFNAAATFFPPMAEALALPPGHQPFGSMMIGWPKLDYQRIPARRPARVAWR